MCDGFYVAEFYANTYTATGLSSLR